MYINIYIYIEREREMLVLRLAGPERREDPLVLHALGDGGGVLYHFVAYTILHIICCVAVGHIVLSQMIYYDILHTRIVCSFVQGRLGDRARAALHLDDAVVLGEAVDLRLPVFITNFVRKEVHVNYSHSVYYQ